MIVSESLERFAKQAELVAGREIQSRMKEIVEKAVASAAEQVSAEMMHKLGELISARIVATTTNYGIEVRVVYRWDNEIKAK